MRKPALVLISILILTAATGCDTPASPYTRSGYDRTEYWQKKFEKNAAGAAELAENVWKDSAIAGKDDEHWYKFTAAAGKTYRVQLNDAHGDGTKTSRVFISAFRADGSLIEGFRSPSLNYPELLSDISGTVYLCVETSLFPLSQGTYALRFYDPSTLAPQVTGIFSGGAFITGTRNYQDKDFSGTMITYTPVCDASGCRFYRAESENGLWTILCEYPDAPADGWIYHDTNVIPGTAYWYKAAAFNASGEGKTTGPWEITAAPNIAGVQSLTLNTLVDGAIRKRNASDYYRFEAEAGKRYSFKINTAHRGDGTKSGGVTVYVFSANGSKLELRSAGWDNPWARPGVITGFSGTIVVQALASLGTGTYSVEVTREDN